MEARRAPAYARASMAAAKRPKNPDEAALRDLGLSFPETTEDFPWGHRTLKVKGKAFVFMGTGAEAGARDDAFFISCKLPESAPMALTLPGVAPTGYGLGKAGWVSASFPPGRAPVAMLKEWLRESYCAVAPKKLAAIVAGGGGAGEAPRAIARKAKGKAKGKTIARKANRKAKRPATSKKRAARARGVRRAG
jgi:predicted DNA-binding protein (MmcQ/YjbR family)